MLVTLYDTDVQFEVTVKDFRDYRIIKENLLHKTVGTKRKFCLAAVITILIVMLTNVDHTTLFNNLIESTKCIDLGRVNTEELMRK